MPRPAISDDALLDAAGRLFRRRGYAATGMREIAAAAGVLLGSLQYRFRTKEAILVALMRRGMRHAIEAMDTAVALSSDPRERIRLCMRAHLRLLITLDDATYVLLYEWRSLGPRLKKGVTALRDRYEARWDALLLDAQAKGIVRRSLDLKMVRLLLLGALNWTPQWYDPRQNASIDSVADAYCQAILPGSGPVTRARSSPARLPASS